MHVRTSNSTASRYVVSEPKLTYGIQLHSTRHRVGLPITTDSGICTYVYMHIYTYIRTYIIMEIVAKMVTLSYY